MDNGWLKFASSLGAALAVAGIGLIAIDRPDRTPPTGGARHEIPEPSSRALQEGDLIFRRGAGLWSALFAEASRQDHRYSHVGVALRAGSGEWVVIHASASDLTGVGCVDIESLAGFLGEAVAWEIRRPAIPGEALPAFIETLRRAARDHTPFDADFDLGSTEQVYCTELVWRAWMVATGTDPIPEKTMWRDKLRIISIEDLLQVTAPAP